MLIQPHLSSIPRPHANVLESEATLHVCTVISNPVRYQSRYKLYEQFKAQTAGPHVQFWTVEIAFADRQFMLEIDSRDRHLQLRTTSEIWNKENGLNLLKAYVMAQIPGADYFAWVDADVTFTRADWAYETLQQLQHYDVVQMFSHVQDVGPKFQPIGQQQYGFMYAYWNGLLTQADNPNCYYGYGKKGFGHPGYAWAARKSALNTLGGLLDVCILGSADHHMALAYIGELERSIHPALSADFKTALRVWGERAGLLKRNVGYVDGFLQHHWHGCKADRRYRDRWKILIKNNYEPSYDLKRDIHGLWQLTDRNIDLRDDLRSYFRARNEDSLEVV